SRRARRWRTSAPRTPTASSADRKTAVTAASLVVAKRPGAAKRGPTVRTIAGTSMGGPIAATAARAANRTARAREPAATRAGMPITATATPAARKGAATAGRRAEARLGALVNALLEVP